MRLYAAQAVTHPCFFSFHHIFFSYCNMYMTRRMLLSIHHHHYTCCCIVSVCVFFAVYVEWLYAMHVRTSRFSHHNFTTLSANFLQISFSLSHPTNNCFRHFFYRFQTLYACYVVNMLSLQFLILFASLVKDSDLFYFFLLLVRMRHTFPANTTHSTDLIHRIWYCDN